MGTHPNAILLCTLTPDDLTRKTFRAICADVGCPEDDARVKLGDEDYSITVMEGTYDESYQLSAKEGDIVVHDFITYGYGELIAWDELARRQATLAEWANGICERHKCEAKFFVSANYW